MKRNIVVFISGTGTNLEAILNAVKNNILNANVVGVISNNENALGIEIAKKYKIPTFTVTHNRKTQTREEYDKLLVTKVKIWSFDLIVLAGWMHVFTNEFLNNFSHIINLHPALPGQFPGKSAITDAYKAFKEGKITKTGIMVHKVIKEVDEGEVIDTVEVPIFSKDTEENLITRIKYFEKSLLISSIEKTLDKLGKKLYKLVHSGKVREMYDIGYNLLYIQHSDRLSAFDKHICNVAHKGKVLSLSSEFWFEKTAHIIPNHMLYARDNIMIVKKSIPFKVEVVVRGYITGNTNTSLWTHYAKGVRKYCGITFPDGLKKNQKIEPVVTPTTKGVTDMPISGQEVVSMGLMEEHEWEYVSNKALKLFEFGQKLADEKGLILVDTKYEFGRDVSDNRIQLIDEIHTCDSSRFWIKKTYNERYKNEQNPQALDKDRVRNYLREVCDPYERPLPEIPVDVISNTSEAYKSFYNILTGDTINDEKNCNEHYYLKDYFENYHSEIAVILSGSESDAKFVDRICKELNKNGIYSKRYIASAHRQTQKVLSIINQYGERGGKIIWITVAGRSNALSGVVAANTKYPVIACPPFKDKNDMMVNINSSIQCPSNVPVMTILEPGNVALTVKRIYNL